MSLPQPARLVVERVRSGGIGGVRIHVVNSGRRAAIVRPATSQSAGGCSPSTSPGVEHVRIAGLRPRFVPQVSNSLPGRRFVRCHVRESDDRTGLRFGLRPGADPAVQPRRSRHAGEAIRRQCRCAKSCTQCARSQARTTAAPTLRMGRRIMAERRRPRTGRGRRHWTHARANDKGSRGASADASLRAFVRALARQAARECFELELNQQSGTIQ